VLYLALPDSPNLRESTHAPAIAQAFRSSLIVHIPARQFTCR
jgi:hypothetical protein